MIKVFNVLKVFKSLNDFTIRTLHYSQIHYRASEDFECIHDFEDFDLFEDFEDTELFEYFE